MTPIRGANKLAIKIWDSHDNISKRDAIELSIISTDEIMSQLVRVCDARNPYLLDILMYLQEVKKELEAMK